MDMTIDEFYKQLSNVYETGSPETVELYLNDRLKEASHGCDMCFDSMEITVSNELGSFYRGMGQFDKSAEFFEIAKRRYINARRARRIENAGSFRHADGLVVNDQCYHLSVLPPLKMP